MSEDNPLHLDPPAGLEQRLAEERERCALACEAELLDAERLEAKGSPTSGSSVARRCVRAIRRMR